ncbi:MAG: hypothetical protein M5U34_04245 [Chloroflexi bacterium]|nr:hypothetical protein [Chloroflexota bacterium]
MGEWEGSMSANDTDGVAMGKALSGKWGVLTGETSAPPGEMSSLVGTEGTGSLGVLAGGPQAFNTRSASKRPIFNVIPDNLDRLLDIGLLTKDLT